MAELYNNLNSTNNKYVQILWAYAVGQCCLEHPTVTDHDDVENELKLFRDKQRHCRLNKKQVSGVTDALFRRCCAREEEDNSSSTHYQRDQDFAVIREAIQELTRKVTQ